MKKIIIALFVFNLMAVCVFAATVDVDCDNDVDGLDLAVLITTGGIADQSKLDETALRYGCLGSQECGPCVAAQLHIPLRIQETLGIARTEEMVHNGIPIARSDNLLSTDELVVMNNRGTENTADDTQIPAAFEVLSRWAGGKDETDKPIQWLLVTFPASMQAFEINTDFYLTSGTPIPKTATVIVAETMDAISVNTGPADFVISKNDFSFFDEILQGGNVIASGNGGSHSTIQGQSQAGANAPRQITIERENDHYVVIKVEGDYANTPVGPQSAKPLSYKIRYEFFAGSPTAVVYHKFYWSGYDGSSNGRPTGDYYITIDNVSLNLPEMTHYASTDVYADSSTFSTGTLSGSQTASVAQRLRVLFDNPHLAEVTFGTEIQSTQFALEPMLINRSDNGAIAVSIDHMKYFEPQSIATNAQGNININLIAENQDFANLQGTWARVGISALPSDTTYNETLALNYAPLNNRLFVFPNTAYVKESKVFQELVSLTSDNPIINEYLNKIDSITQRTREFFDQEKFHGLMTWGTTTGYPTLLGDSLGWDKIYEGAWNTDYHNTWNNLNKQFALKGDSSILYDLSFMAARRMLHTQIIQPDWEASSDFMGWGYAGYGRYRSDPNSSHSYFENLLNYYYLTGDMEVIDIIKVGAENKRDDYTRESDGTLNDPFTGGVDWVDRVDRRGMQTAKMFQFMGHAHDAAYLDDFIHIYNHAFTRSLVLLEDSLGDEYGFLSTNQDTTSGFPCEQIWMTSFYFLNYLYELYSEFGDLEIGAYQLKISRVYEALMNGFLKYENQTNNGWDQSWYNQLTIYYTGDQIGGTITSVEGTNTQGNPLTMYNSGKFPVITAYLRAGKIGNNQVLTDYGIEGIDWAVGYHEYIDAADDHWGKVNAMLFNRTHHAMAYLQSLSVTTDVLPEATQGTFYTTQLQAVQGSEPYTWSIAAGSLPQGLSLQADGVISGIPAEPSTSPQLFGFTAQVIDNAGNFATQSLSITLYSNALAITTTALADAEQGVSYSQTINAINGTPPYVLWEVTSGSLPGGLAIDNGQIFGVPNETGSFDFTLQVTDSDSSTTTADLNISVNPPTPRQVHIRVNQSSDDAEETTTGQVFLISDLELAEDSGYPQSVGIRFQNLDIPQGAIISHAYIQFTAEETGDDAVDLMIRGENRSDSLTFSDQAHDITNTDRPRTISQVAWSGIPAWDTVGASLEAVHRTPNLADIVQEIVDRGDWVQGNPITFFITGTGRRTAHSYDTSNNDAPLLHVEFYNGSN